MHADARMSVGTTPPPTGPAVRALPSGVADPAGGGGRYQRAAASEAAVPGVGGGRVRAFPRVPSPGTPTLPAAGFAPAGGEAAPPPRPGVRAPGAASAPADPGAGLEPPERAGPKAAAATTTPAIAATAVPAI